jgi:hypothetical protein
MVYKPSEDAQAMRILAPKLTRGMRVLASWTGGAGMEAQVFSLVAVC